MTGRRTSQLDACKEKERDRIISSNTAKEEEEEKETNLDKQTNTVRNGERERFYNFRIPEALCVMRIRWRRRRNYFKQTIEKKGRDGGGER